MIKKILTIFKWLFAISLLFILLLLLAITILLTTNIGARIAVGLGTYFTPVQVSVDHVKGRLIDDIRLDHIYYSQGPLTADIQQAHLKWSFLALLKGRLAIEYLGINGIDIHQAAGSSPTNSMEHYPVMPKLDKVQWPIPLTVKKFQLNEIHWQLPTMVWSIDQAQGKIQINPKGHLYWHLNWQHGKWLTPSATPLLTTSEGGITVSGSLHQYRVRLQGKLHQHVQDISLKVKGRAQGDLQHLLVNDFKVHTLQGQLQLEGNINWAPQLDWDFKVKGDHLNASQYLPVSLSKLKFGLTSKGSWSQSTKLTTQLAINHLSGRFNQHALKGQLQLAYRPGKITLHKAHLNLGHNTLQAQGNVGRQYDFDWHIKAPDLDVIWPGLQGRLQSHGQLKGTTDQPQLHGIAEAHKLVFKQWHLSMGDAEARIDWPQHSEIKLHLHHVSMPSQVAIDDLTLLGHGSAQLHQFDLAMQNQWGHTQATIKGQYKQGHWLGLLTQWQIKGQKVGQWQLQQPSLIKVDDHFNSSNITLHSDQYGTIQMRGYWQSKDDWSLQGQLHHLNLRFLQHWLAYKFKQIQSDISGKGYLTNNGHLHGQLQLNIDSATVSSPEVKTPLNLKSGSATAHLDANKGLKVNGELQGEQPDWHTQFEASLPDFTGQSWPQKQDRITASAEGHVPKLDFLNNIISQVRHLKGQLDYHLTAQGTWGQPQLKGQAQLKQGQMTIVPLAIKLHDINLGLKAHQQKLEVSGSLYSQKGKLGIQGHGNWHDVMNPQLTLNATGENVLVMDTPEYQVHASPQLVMVIEPKKIAISGVVDVPRARIKPLDLSTVQTLPDTVHIQGQDETQTPWQVYLRTRIILGDDVLLRYEGLKAQLDGQVTVSHAPGQLMLGIGKLYVKQGYYKAYDRQIDINHGQLTFTGGPLANPGLDILATRTIEVSHIGEALSGSGSNVQVGFKIQGDAKNPDVELYSSPNMPSQDILSYLVFGQSATKLSESNSAMLNQAINAAGLTGHSVLDNLKNDLGLNEFGVESKRFYNPDTQTTEQTSALVLGEKLTDRLSVKYSVGLLDPITELKIEYRITKGLSLTTGTSPYGTGADLMYTFETD